MHEVMWGIVRYKVHQRDRGVCAICGWDTDKLLRVLRWIGKIEKNPWGLYCHQDRKASLAVQRELGLTPFIDPWQADHIRPRCRGGKNRLDNLRTLCVPCHKVETKKLAGERAVERRTTPLFLEAERAGKGKVTREEDV